ncbi:MAG TPA: MBL fold metallo-hydrolase [Clostridia bacterium]|nr:MBL fold metallo-hydrolase [Clostridia bacterium]
MHGWVEVGDRVFIRRYAFYDQNIGVILGDGAALVIDTRSTHAQGREILADLRALSRDPVTVVVDTHGHFDHVFGNAVFRPAAIWGHVGCGPFMRRTGEARRPELTAGLPDLADDLREVEIDPPDRSFEEHATIDVGGRAVELRFLGRGHTDHDIAVVVPGAAVVFGGDLIENGAVPSFGDSYPLDWPATVDRLVPFVDGVAVPGHGDPGDRDWVRSQAEALHTVADLARQVVAGELDREAALERTPYLNHPAEDLRRPLERAIRQVRGEELGPRAPSA